MKKLVFIAVAVLLLEFASGLSYECSDGEEIELDTEEINIGSVKRVNGLSLGLCDSDVSVASSRWIVYLITDAKQFVLNGTNSPQNIEVSGGTYSVRFSDVTENKVSMSVGGTSGEVEINECGEVGSLAVMFVELQQEGENKSVKILAGKTKVLFDSREKISEIFESNSKKYLITAETASDADVVVSVGKCASNEFTEIVESVSADENSTNETISQNYTNSTEIEINLTDADFKIIELCNEIGLENETKYCNGSSFERKKEKGETCLENYECSAGKCKKECAEKNILDKFIDWIRGFFG